MHPASDAWRIRCLCGLMLAALPARSADGPPAAPLPLLTNVAAFRGWHTRHPDDACRFRVEANVWWANTRQGRAILQDASGVDEFEVDLSSSPIQSGQRIRLEGHGLIARRGARFRLGTRGPVVDNNGTHALVEKSGAVYLDAGQHPIRVEWFNGSDKAGLEIDYAGPGLSRRKIPDAALFRTLVDGVSPRDTSVNGLDFRCYEGSWKVLPDFNSLTPVKVGTASNFDPAFGTRTENVALQFTGLLATPADGTYTFHVKSDDGSRLFVGAPALRVEMVGAGSRPAPRRIAIGQPLPSDDPGGWAELEGMLSLIREAPEGWQIEVSSGPSRMRVELGDPSGLSAAQLLNRRVRATGFCQASFTTDGDGIAGVLLVPSAREIQVIEPEGPNAGAGPRASGLPLLTTAEAVHRLKREEAQRGYPAKIRGVVTGVQPEHQAFTLQDATRGLYVVDASAYRSELPAIREFVEVEGTTDPGLFAPLVNGHRIRSLGAGHLPEPVRPTWDQLLNGSLDAQYVELRGIITALVPEGVILLTREGRIKLELRATGRRSDELARFENALVRVRGCLFATWDYLTHQVKVGEIRVYDADVTVEQPAAEDAFSAPRKTASELLLFDPNAGAFQRVQVSGQLVHIRGEEHFMMDGTRGLRFLTKASPGLAVGDVVEVVGFPELSSSVSPVLREAVARRIEHRPLPPAKPLAPDELLRVEHDVTRVQIEGSLMSVRRTGADTVLELQNDAGTVVARLNDPDEALPSLPLGGRLRLTGVYAALGGPRIAGHNIVSFELLLNSAADIRVLARPPWWTLGRLLFIVGALACALALAALWITQLRRQVDRRTIELETQMRERQRVEQQHAMEQERARIARDLHDDLGSGITEISMLATRARSATAADETRRHHLEQAGAKAREMVAALDEIVWAMNPQHDSLASLVSYFSLYADRFLGLANIAWRLEGPSGPVNHVVDSRHRHQLFLAFKEALTNVVRHSEATEVRVTIQLEAGQVRLTIADNGRGLPADSRREEMDGVANMRSRLEKLGGRFEAASEPGRGTRLHFCLPANGVEDP